MPKAVRPRTKSGAVEKIRTAGWGGKLLLNGNAFSLFFDVHTLETVLF